MGAGALRALLGCTRITQNYGLRCRCSCCLDALSAIAIGSVCASEFCLRGVQGLRLSHPE